MWKHIFGLTVYYAIKSIIILKSSVGIYRGGGLLGDRVGLGGLLDRDGGGVLLL